MQKVSFGIKTSASSGFPEFTRTGSETYCSSEQRWFLNSRAEGHTCDPSPHQDVIFSALLSIFAPGRNNAGSTPRHPQAWGDGDLYAVEFFRHASEPAEEDATHCVLFFKSFNDYERWLHDERDLRARKERLGFMQSSVFYWYRWNDGPQFLATVYF